MKGRGRVWISVFLNCKPGLLQLLLWGSNFPYSMLFKDFLFRFLKKERERRKEGLKFYAVYAQGGGHENGQGVRR